MAKAATRSRPVQVEAAGALPVLSSTVIDSPVGDLLAVATADALTLLEFHDRRALAREMRDIERQFGAAAPAPEPTTDAHPVFDPLRAQLGEYFAAKRGVFEIPLDIRGSAWERSVWDQLLRIPCGQTRSYEDIAIALERPGAQRAVGMANGRNRIAILVPCHRVIQKNGELRGYGGGLHRKAYLLELERSIAGSSLW